jgi:hypothetical protein
MSIPAADAPTFDGQAIFGDLASFAYAQLVQGRPIDVDTWLGLAPGTTTYGADPNGRLFGVRGTFIATTIAGVWALESTLYSFAGLAASFGVPTGLPWPGDYYFWPSCLFTLADYQPAATTPIPANGNMYALAYSIVIRQTGNP